MNGSRSTYMRKGYLLTALAAAVLLAASSGTAWAQTRTGSDDAKTVLSDLEIRLSGPRTVVEGEEATITVRATAMVAPTVKWDDPDDADTGDDDAYNNGHLSGTRKITVYLGLTGMMVGSTSTGEFGVERQVDDADIVSNPTVALTFAENTGSSARERAVTGSITVRTNGDSDAENEGVLVGLNTDDATGGVEGGITAPVEDDAGIEDVDNIPATVLVPMVNDDTNSDGTFFRATFTIVDDETQTYVLSLNTDVHNSTNPPMEGSEIHLFAQAKPAHVDDSEALTLQLTENGERAQRGYSVDPTTPITVMGGGKMPITIETPSDDDGDGNRVTDTIGVEAYSGDPGRDDLEASLDIEVLDVHMLPAAEAITAVAKDEDGNEVAEIMEGGDPVLLTITVDRGKGAGDRITDEDLTVDIRPADPGQLADYELSEARIELESRNSGKQTNDTEIELSARSDEDVGMEYLVLNFEVSGASSRGSETSTGTFTIAIVDDTAKKVEPKSEDDAYPAIMAAIEEAAGEDGLNPGESFMVMTSDLFTVMDGYTASYRAAVEGGAVSVSASSDTVTVTAREIGESKVTVTATAAMAASSFIPEQTVSDVASITFPVMVVEGMPEPVPALPLFGQLLLALFMMAGGARLYRRRQG